ncbi:MAG: PAS domain S-box protein [Actinomycetota bacterium]|nr:PAS domain S-box protein [Actinomycetota bacterium]
MSAEHPATFELAGVGTAQADPATGRLLRVNPKLCEITGYSKEELLGMTFTQITHPEDRQKNIEGFQQTVRGETSEYEAEKRYVRKDGQDVWVSVNTTIIRDEAGQPLRTLAVIQDITGRMQAEEKLRESNTLLRSIIEGVNDAIFAKDIRGRYLMINSAWASILGKPKKEILGKVDSEILPPEVARRFMEFDHLVMAAGENRTFEEEVPTAGGMCTFLTTKAPYRDSQGEMAGVIGIAHDITERKRAEAEIEARSRQQAVVAEISMRALADTNLSVLMNEAVSLIARTLDCEYCELLELLPDGNELLLAAGVGWKEGLVGNATVGAGLDSQAGYTLLSDEPVIVEDLRKESRFSGSPLLNEHGVVSGMSVLVPGEGGAFGVLGVHTTEPRTFSRDDVNFLQAVANALAAAVGRRSAEETLIQVREAERSRIARDMHDEALQDIIYALREIDAHRQLSEGSEQGAGLEEAANALRRSIAGLHAAIFDLPLAGGDEDGDFVENLESLVRSNRQSLPDREIELSIEGNLPRSLGTRTEVELQRIVQEALANVRRHSGASHISVAVGASGGNLWAEVEDDGRGFGPETPAGMGTRGMRERARALGGSLKIESEPGKGTKVRFEMALRTGSKETESEEPIRIFLVEDHASFREATAAIFEREPGFEVVGQADSLAAARKMLEDGTSEADVAVLDLTLPDGYGGNLIKELRAVNPRAQALVLSATLDRAEIARAVEAGAAGVVHKSTVMDEVIEAVRRVRAGEMLLPLDEVVELLRFAGAQREQEQKARQAIAQLTPREKEVLQALAEGLDSKEIAERLSISVPTERNHVASILAKLGVHSRLQALIFAVKHSVVEIR